MSVPVGLGGFGGTRGGVGVGDSGSLVAPHVAGGAPSLSRPSLLLLLISSTMFSIAWRVSLVLDRASNVSLERPEWSLRYAFLLISASSLSCFASNLRKKASSVQGGRRRGSGLCAIARW